MLRLSHILTTAALVAVCAAPASAATFEQLHQGDRTGDAQATADTGWRSSYQPAPPSDAGTGKGYVLNREYGSPDRIDATRDVPSSSYVLNRDYGSPDAADAAQAHTAGPDSFVLNRDYGSPDAVDAGRNLPPVQIPTVVADGAPSTGFDWGDAGIGAAGMFGLFAIAAGSALLLLAVRRRGQRLA